MPRIGPLHVAVAGSIALLLVGVGGAVADVPSAEQHSVERTAGSYDSGLLQDGEVNITAPRADGGPYEVGEAVPVELELEGTEVATVTISATDSSQDARFTATVRDNDSSGNVTLSFDTGAFDVIETDGFVVGEGAELVNTSAEYSDAVAEAGLDPAAYTISVSPNEQAHDEENGTLADSVAVQLVDPFVEISSPTAGASVQGNETLPIDLSMDDTEVGTLSITFVGGEAVDLTATVRDADDNGNATVTFDPAAVVEGNDAFSAPNGTTLVDSSVESDGSMEDGLAVPTLYDIGVTPSEQSPDAAGVSPSDSLELVVTGGGEIGANGSENGGEDTPTDGDGTPTDGGETPTDGGDGTPTDDGQEGSGDETPTDDGEDDSADDDGPGFGVLIALGALVALALGARLRSDG